MDDVTKSKNLPSNARRSFLKIGGFSFFAIPITLSDGFKSIFNVTDASVDSHTVAEEKFNFRIAPSEIEDEWSESSVKRRKILHILFANGAYRTKHYRVQKTFERSQKKIKDQAVAKELLSKARFKKILKSIVEDHIRYYYNNYSDTELDELLAFYRSDVGKKLYSKLNTNHFIIDEDVSGDPVKELVDKVTEITKKQNNKSSIFNFWA